MPEARPVPLAPPPGVVKTEGARVIQGRWSDTQWMRFVNGRPQKRGGFSRVTSVTASGSMRAMHAWRDLSAQEYLAAGTERKLYIFDRTFNRTDITPIDASGTLGANPFATISGKSTVTVTHASHGRVSGASVTFSGATAVGGLTLNGTFTVLVVTAANTYTIDAGANAGASASGGGASVAYSYELNPGAALGTYALGYGVGGYGLSFYGVPRTVSSLQVEPRIWSLKNYGSLLYAAYNTGTIYTFDPADLSSPNPRATVLANAPADVRFMFITEERYPFALCENMVVRWPDLSDNTIWAADDTNTANERRLTDGTKLVGGLALAQLLSLIWSDNAAYVFQYTGNSSIYDSRKVATNCGLIAPHAACADSDGNAYWMSSHSFHYYDGGVHEMPNVEDIKAFVFDRLRTDQPYVCWAYYNTRFHEVTFFYVPAGEEAPHLSVTYSIRDQAWETCDWSDPDFERLAATKFQHGDTRPYLAGSDGHIYLHDDGVNTADGAAILASVTLAPSEVADGAANVALDGLRIDVADQAGALTLTISAYDSLRGGVIDSEEKTVLASDELIDTRVAGRLIGLQLTSNAVDGYFRWGKPIALIQGGGARR